MAVNRQKWVVGLVEIVLLVLVLAVGVLVLRMGLKMVREQMYPLAYEEIVEKYAQERELPVELIYAVIYTESRFRPDATSSIGAMGLMQVTPDAYDWVRYRQGLAPEKDKARLYDPEENVAVGTYMLRLLLSELKETENALAAYHAGRSRVLEWLDNPEYAPNGKVVTNIPYADTKAYVENVTKMMAEYKAILEKES